jgi:hypothetical protein
MVAAPPVRSRPRATPARGLRRRTFSPLAVVPAVAGVLLVALLWGTGASESGSHKSSTRQAVAAPSRSVSRPHSTPTEPKPRPKPLAATDSLGAHSVFAGQAFSIAYPRGWTVKAAEVPTLWGTDTTIVAPGDPHTMVRVDVVRNPATSDPFTVARPVIAGVAGQPGYRVLGLSSGTFSRRPAALWEFLVAETGVMVHKQDVFFTPQPGTVIALLTSAPAPVYGSLATRFTAIRRSLVAHG